METPPVDGPVAAFCGIAQPEQFFHGLEAAGLRLARASLFSDHHDYSVADLSRMAVAARKAGAVALLTTEKDCVRIGALAESLPELLPIQTAKLRIEIENAAIDWLIGGWATADIHRARVMKGTRPVYKTPSSCRSPKKN